MRFRLRTLLIVAALLPPVGLRHSPPIRPAPSMMERWERLTTDQAKRAAEDDQYLTDEQRAYYWLEQWRNSLLDPSYPVWYP